MFELEQYVMVSVDWRFKIRCLCIGFDSAPCRAVQLISLTILHESQVYRLLAGRDVRIPFPGSPGTLHMLNFWCWCWYWYWWRSSPCEEVSRIAAAAALIRGYPCPRFVKSLYVQSPVYLPWSIAGMGDW